MNADGSGLRTLIDEPGAWDNEVAWGVSPDVETRSFVEGMVSFITVEGS